MLNDAFRKRMPHFLVAAAAKRNPNSSKTAIPQPERPETRNRKRFKLLWLQRINQSSIKLKNKFSTDQKKRKSSEDSSANSLDWRSLSPDRPPLPFFLTDKLTNDKNNESIHQRQQHFRLNKSRPSHTSYFKNLFSSSSVSSSSSLDNTHNISLLLQNTTLKLPMDTMENSNSNTNSQAKTTNKRNSDNPLPLSPILEESETMAMDSATTSASSNVHSNNQIFNNNGVEKNDSQMSIECTSSIVTTSIIKEGPPSIHNGVSATNVTQNINQQQRPEPSISSNLSSASTLDQLTENSIVEDILKDDHNQDANESIDRLRQRGGEEECKRKFAKMVLAAIRFQNKQDRKPQYTALVFHPVTGNIEKMRVIYSGKAEYHKFCGNAQYLPPELSMITTADKQKEYPQKQQQSDKGYNSEMIDVWVLGIFLYRLLTGRYPFMASNDHQLFKKMIHSDFNVPDYLTEDAKDIIKRMLAPYGTRASLDIVIHHPWLANYRHRLLDYHKQYCHDQMEDLNKRSITTNHEGDITVNQESLENEQCRTKPPSLICNSASKRTVLSHKKSIKRFNSVGTTSTVMLHQHIVTATPNYHERTSPHSNSKTYRSLHQHKGRRGISFKKAFTFVFQGPFPPPKRPYQDLSHLGTRKSVFLNCRA